MWKQIVLSVATLTIGFVAGWFARHGSDSPMNPEIGERASESQLVPEERKNASPKRLSLSDDYTPEELAAAVERGDRQAAGLYRQLAEADPKAAYEMLDWSSPRVRRHFLREVYGHWIVQDQAAALASAALETEDRRMLYGHLGELLAKRDPEHALEVGRTLAGGASRKEFLTEVFDTFFLSDPIDACKRLAEFPESRLFSPSRFYFESGMDPPDLSPDLMDAMVDALPPDRMEGVLSEIFREYWVNSEIEEAREWAFNLPVGSLRDRVAEEILWSDSYSESHFERLKKMNLTSEERVRLMVNRSAAIAAVDPMIGLEAAREIEDPASQHLAERSVYGTWIKNDPAAAIEFLSTESPTDLRYFSSEIAGILSDSLPQEAIASALEIAAVAEDASLLTHVFGNVAKEDFTLATTQLDAIPAGEDRDAAVIGILESASERSRTTSLNWALTINDPESRQKHAVRQLSAWASKDISGAQTWLERAVLSLEPEVHSEMSAIIDEAVVNNQRRSRSVSSGFGDVIVYY